MKTHVLPGLTVNWYVEVGVFELTVNWYVEVGVFEIYGGYPLPRLQGGSYCLWGLHFE